MRPGSLMLAHAAAPPVAGLNGHRCTVRDLECCPYVALPESWDAYTRGLGKRMRSNIGYYERLLTRTCPDAHTDLSGPDTLDEAMGALFDLHGRRWRSRMMPGVLGSRAARSFHRDVARRFSERGWLRLHVTRAGGSIVAALYCFAYRGRTYYYLGGFDPSLGRLSIGTTLTAAAIRHAIGEGNAEFDFLRGHEAYKYRWAPAERHNAQVIVGRPRSARSAVMSKLNDLERFVERRAKELSDRRSAGRQTGPPAPSTPRGGRSARSGEDAP
jgi:CelD/BcsL family acetyltransferase involved in cellulose biosynthesis